MAIVRASLSRPRWGGLGKAITNIADEYLTGTPGTTKTDGRNIYHYGEDGTLSSGYIQPILTDSDFDFSQPNLSATDAINQYNAGQITYDQMQKLVAADQARTGDLRLDNGNAAALPQSAVQVEVAGDLSRLTAANGGDATKAMQAFAHPTGLLAPDQTALTAARAIASPGSQVNIDPVLKAPLTMAPASDAPSAPAPDTNHPSDAFSNANPGQASPAVLPPSAYGGGSNGGGGGVAFGSSGGGDGTTTQASGLLDNPMLIIGAVLAGVVLFSGRRG